MVADLLVISIGAILINNFVLVQFLGICPFLGVSKKVDTSVGMGFAVVFVMACASIITWCVQYYLLVPFHLEYLQTIAFILVIAVLVQFVEMFLKKSIPSLYLSLIHISEPTWRLFAAYYYKLCGAWCSYTKYN